MCGNSEFREVLLDIIKISGAERSSAAEIFKE